VEREGGRGREGRGGEEGEGAEEEDERTDFESVAEVWHQQKRNQLEAESADK
jgi:hypothetical protein